MCRLLSLAFGFGVVMLLAAVSVCANAEDAFTLDVHRLDSASRYITLSFKNVSKADLELLLPVEGGGDCDKYFDIEAVKRDGDPARKSLLYAPDFQPYTVLLKPGGFYNHFIQPEAYLNGANLDTLKKLRVKYTNKLTGASVLSDWLILQKD